MKKTLIIGFIGLAAIWTLAMPAVVGVYLQDWVTEWLDEALPRSEAKPDSGWFETRLDLAEPPYTLAARARHFPLPGPAWVRLDAEISAPFAAKGIEADGHIGLTGNTRLALNAETLAWEGRAAVMLGSSRLDLDQRPGRRTRLELEGVDALALDAHGNRLAFERFDAETIWSLRDDELGRLEIRLDLTDEAGQPAGLSIHAEPIRPDALADLVEGLEQLGRARPESMDRQIALLTLTGAWQQLAEAGLVIELETFRLDAESAVQGHWHVAADELVVRGDGSLAAIIDRLGPIVGLSLDLSPAEAERQLRDWLATLSANGWLTVEDGRFDFDYPPERASESSGG